ncbi:MAG TPA: AsmA family protein [Acidobacteriota bacterium]|nr:AsmA family protein [Acidobacteriota bacterium]
MKKLLKILAWLAGIIVLLVILIIVGFELFFPKERARQLAIERGSEALGREVSVQDIDISLWGGLGVKLVDVAVASPEDITTDNLLEADNVDVKLRLWPLLKREIRVDRFIVNRPRIALVKTKQGRTNYEFPTVDSAMPPEVAEQPAAAKAAGAAVSFDALEINGGRLSYRDDSSGLALVLTDLNLSTALENPAPGRYASQGRVSIDSLAVTRGQTYPAVSLDLHYAGEYDLNEKRLSVEKADLQVNGLKFNMTAEVSDPLGEPRATGNVKSDRITVADLFKLLPQKQRDEIAEFRLDGDFSFDVDVQYDASVTENALTYAGTAVISDMTMAREGIEGELRFRRALLDFKPDNLRMNIEDGTFDGEPFKGHLVVDNFDDPVVNGELAGSVNLAFAQPFLPPEGGHEVAGRARADLKFSGRTGDVKSMSFSGNLTVTEGRYNSPQMPEPIEALSVDAYFDNKLVNVRTFEARFKSGYVNFSGRIDNLVAYLMADSVQARKVSPSVDGTFKGELDLAMLGRYLPEKGQPELTGRLAVDVKVAGGAARLADIKPRGRLTVTKGTYTDSLMPEPITNFAVEMALQPDTIAIDRMYLKFTSSDVTFTGKLVNPFPYLLPVKGLDRTAMTKPLFLFTLSSRRFDTDRLFPEAVPGSGENRASKPVDSVSLVILPDIDGRGTLHVDTLIYSKVEFTDLDGKVRIKDRRIECYDVTGNVYSGKVSGTTTIDLNDFDNPVYTGEFKGDQVDVDDFMSRFTRFGGHVFGKCDLTGGYTARGWEPDEFLNSLTMNGRGNMLDGKIVTSGTLYKLISGLADKAGQSFSEEQPIKNLGTDILVKDGKIVLDNLKTRLTQVGDIEIGGFYGFDGSIGYSGSLLLSQEVTEKLVSKGGLLGGLAGLLTDKTTARLALPLKISGTADSPKAELDYSALTKTAGDDLGKKAGNLLEDLLKKKDKK